MLGRERVRGGIFIKTNQEIAQEVLSGLWGNGQDRRDRLTAAGYNYDSVQGIVNELVRERDAGTAAVYELVPDPDPGSEPDGNFLEIEVNLSVYDGIKLVFTEENDDTK